MRHDGPGASFFRRPRKRELSSSLLAAALLLACAEAPDTNDQRGGLGARSNDDDDEQQESETSKDDKDSDGERDEDEDDDGDEQSVDAGTKLDAAPPRPESSPERSAPSDGGTEHVEDELSLDAGAPSAASSSDGGGVDAARGGGLKDGASASAADASDEGSALCHLAGNQVGVIGDSYLDLSGDVTRFLQENARRAGALGEGDRYLDQARSGASMAYDPRIPDQFTLVLQAARQRRSAGVKLIVMTGGGNDVLLYNRQCLDGRPPTPACMNVVEQTVRELKKLFIDMAASGVEHVIYFWYPDLPGGGLGGPRPQVMNGYAAPIMQAACESNSELECHFIDTRPAFQGHPEYLSGVDDVHPSAAGSRAIAELIWWVMSAQCLASR